MAKYLNLLFLFLLISCASKNPGLTFPNTSSNNSSNTSSSTSSKSTIDHFAITKDLNPIYVNVNVIILKRDAKSKSNFDLKDPEEKKILEDYFENINRVWSSFIQPENLSGCYTGTDFYPDSKIRFKFNYIEIIDEKAWDLTSTGADLEAKKYSNVLPSENWYLSYLDQKIMNDPTVPKGILVYLPVNGKEFDTLYKNKGKGYDLAGVEASQFPSKTNLNRASTVLVPNRYLKYIAHRYQAPIEFNTTWQETRGWHINDAVGTAHELGHSLGLSHGNKYHGANQCQYSLMSQVGTHPRNYLQPTEIVLAHTNLRESNLIQFVTEDSFLGNTFIINKNEVWTKTQRFYSNLNLADNVTLTLNEPIILAPNATITFGKNAKIVLEKNGKIIYPNGKDFSHFINKQSGSIINN